VIAEGGTGGEGGFHHAGEDAVYLAPDVCSTMRARLAGRRHELYALAAAIETLVHESIHVRGVHDEGETDCNAMHEMPRVATRFFGFKRRPALRALMAAAWRYHRTAAPQSRTVC
jgi:hypothetical protein